MTAAEAGRKLQRNDKTILRVWTSQPGYKPFQRFRQYRLSTRQTVVCDMFRASGEAGIMLSDMVEQLNALGWVATCDGVQSSFTTINHKLNGQEAAERIKRLSKQGTPCRYALVPVAAVEPEAEAEAEAPVEDDWTPSIPSVSRRITGDLGLGSTPGAIVSVARVTWLDGALHA
jgi:hypothetical protein